MKLLKFIVFIAVIALATAGLQAAAHPSIDVVASNWKFTPNTVTVPVGEQSTLRLTSVEGVHGLASPELGISDTTIMPNKFVTVNFTPKKKGTYTLHCSIVCGAGHPDMTLKVIVQ